MSSYYVDRFNGHVASIAHVRGDTGRPTAAPAADAGRGVVRVVGGRLDAVVVPQRRDDVGHDEVGRVLGDQLEDEDAVLAQVALGEAARHLAVALAARHAVAAQSRHDLEVLTDVAPSAALRQHDPRPPHQSQNGERTEQRQPEPHHQVDLLAEEVDRQDALNGVRVNLAHVAAHVEVAQRDARKDGDCAVPFAAVDDL